MRPLKSRHSALRTIDVARQGGCSVQQVRNLEALGVLPAATRTATGYRSYGAVHVQSALAYRALAAGVGPVEAKTLMRTMHRGEVDSLLALLDAAHARLDRERRDVTYAQEAIAKISAEPMDGSRTTTDAMTISELAGALGVRTSALRHWDAEDLVVPSRSRPGASRIYLPEHVRDARIVHQLRQAGYRIPALQDLLPRLRQPGGRGEVDAVLRRRRTNLTTRSLALLHGSAALETLLTETEPVAEAPTKQ